LNEETANLIESLQHLDQSVPANLAVAAAAMVDNLFYSFL
jgi:hypothetical protein